MKGLAPHPWAVAPEFWVQFPNQRNQRKQAHPVLEYRVPHGSQCVMDRLVRNKLRIVVSQAKIATP
jgi:hypothetical protein